MTPKQRQRARKREKAWRQANQEKCREYARRYWLANKQKVNARQRKYAAEHPEKQKAWENKNKLVRKAIRKRYLSKPENRAKAKAACTRWSRSSTGKAYMKNWHRKRLSIPEKRIRFMLTAARWRARKRGLAFDEALFERFTKDLPSQCTCCGNKLDYKMKGHNRYSRAPSFDRLDSTKGYTMKNTVPVCARCNYIKTDATLEELVTVVAFLKRSS